MTTVLETTDVRAAGDALCRLYGIQRFTATGKRAYLRIEQDTFGAVRMDRLTFGMRCDADGRPLPALCLGHVISGTVTPHRQGSGSAPYGAGDVFLAAQPDLPFHAGIHDADLEYAILSASLIAEVAGTAAPVRFTACQPATPRDRQLWLSTRNFVRDTLTSAAGTQPLVTGAAARLLAATALAVFPNDAVTGPSAHDRDLRPVTLRRAITFIHANAHRDIGPADIAASACVTPRALQLAFRRHLGTTPTAYLRRVRLDNAHRQLTTADPRHQTVTAVAYRWGFPSSSRFAAYYHQAYGIRPSQTLHN